MPPLVNKSISVVAACALKNSLFTEQVFAERQYTKNIHCPRNNAMSASNAVKITVQWCNYNAMGHGRCKFSTEQTDYQIIMQGSTD
jgi:hypothetical protein